MRNYPNRNSVWLNFQFKNITHVPCFWCEKLLLRGKATTDHIVPNYLEKGKEEGNKVVCCTKCNHERSQISTLMADLINVEVWSKRRIAKWFTRRDVIRKLLHKYRELICVKVNQDIQSECLQEINMILRLPKNYFSDKTSRK